MARKRKALSKKFGFQKGNTPATKGKKLKFEPKIESEPFMRLPHTVFESRVSHKSSKVLEVHDVEQSVCPPMLLWPRPKIPEQIDEYLDPTFPDPDNHTYKHYVPSLNNGCDGDLDFDSHAAQKWGFAWRERLKCVTCGFVGQYYKLYHEVNSPAPGRKAATINMGIQAGLMTTSISNKSFRDITLTCNVIPANLSGMQKLANKVGSVIVNFNQQDMKDIRESLVAENEMVGYANPVLVNVETDGRYNNPIFNSDVTAFQAGTQVVQTMVENNTKLKHIVSVFTGNKLCKVASRLRNKGIEVLCPNHAGHCSANLAEDSVIGNETEYARQCTIELNDKLKIAHVTTDGDSKAVNGITNAQRSNVKILRDARCTAELTYAFKAHEGKLFAVKNHMPAVIKAIVLCYSGGCGMSCQINSYVCAGMPSDHWQKGFLPNKEPLKMTSDDEVLVENCINVLLGPKSLELVRFLTSTQKCEAFNRTLQRCNPKIVTHSRNFSGRVHTAVHLRNHKFGNSTILHYKRYWVQSLLLAHLS
ncbi:unnamed protein product [Mytilus coruscus]|uniref:Mutator-like transposase domain-containing protein n=1 Tax=Mytilus coruscus TaxID=42192 RepID=A0A6J8AZL1_MYTCO|nr:unnamed protein product [Mytilus coruscus]